MSEQMSFMGGVIRFFFKGFLILSFVWVFFTFTDDEPKVANTKPYWLNEDHTIHPKDVSSYDYDNRIIHYRDYSTPPPVREVDWVDYDSEEEIDIEMLIDLYED